VARANRSGDVCNLTGEREAVVEVATRFLVPIERVVYQERTLRVRFARRGNEQQQHSDALHGIRNFGVQRNANAPIDRSFQITSVSPGSMARAGNPSAAMSATHASTSISIWGKVL